MVYKNNDKYDDLIKQAGDKIGEDPAKLKNAIDEGKLDKLLSKMKAKDVEKFQEVINNPAMAQQMLNSPQAQFLLKKFMK